MTDFSLQIQAFFLSGIIFGWSPLQEMLTSEGQYSDLCLPSEVVDKITACPEQDSKFVLVYTAASSAFSLFVWPMGALLDKVGPRYSCMTGAALICAGSVIMAFSDSREMDGFVYGYSLMGIGAPAVVFSFMHLSNLFPRRRAAIIALFNVMIDASALVFVIFNVLHENLGVSHRWLFCGYAGFSAVVFLTSPFLWPRHPFQHDEEALQMSLNGGNNNIYESPRRSRGKRDYFISPQKEAESFDLSKIPFGQQIATSAFWVSAIVTSLQLLRVNFYIGTINFQLAATFPDSEKHVQLLTDLFGWILPVGSVLSVPLIGYLLDTHGMVVSTLCLSLAGTVFGGLVFEPSLFGQIATFVVFSFFRAFLFSAMSAFVAVVFGFANFGKLWGLVFAISSLFSASSILIAAQVCFLFGRFWTPPIHIVMIRWTLDSKESISGSMWRWRLWPQRSLFSHSGSFVDQDRSLLFFWRQRI